MQATIVAAIVVSNHVAKAASEVMAKAAPQAKARPVDSEAAVAGAGGAGQIQAIPAAGTLLPAKHAPPLFSSRQARS